MNQTAIFFPIIALVGWTFTVLLLIPFQRFKAVFKKQVIADDFKYGESQNVPGEVRIPNRHYMNLLELPTLFYVACLVLYVTKNVDLVFLSLAWAYVAFRLVHSIVHLTYNKVIHRFSLFVAGNVLLGVIWIRLLIELLNKTNL